MKTRIRFLLVLFSSLGLAAYADEAPSEFPISEAKAEAIIRALPEVVKLEERYRSLPENKGFVFDAPTLVGPQLKLSVKTGATWWHLDIYETVPDGPTQVAHGWPWVFFRVNADSGAVFVEPVILN